MLTPLVYLQQGNLKELKKLRKIVITDENKSSYFPKELSNFNEFFKKGVPYDNIKGHRKTGLYPYSKKYSFGKARLLRVKANNLSGRIF